MSRSAFLLGTFGALVSGLYSLLGKIVAILAHWNKGLSLTHTNCCVGTYLANLARDHSDKTPIQPGPSAILAVFLFFGTFVLNYIRMKFPKGMFTHVTYYTYLIHYSPIFQANFAAVNACILLSVRLSYYIIYSLSVIPTLSL